MFNQDEAPPQVPVPETAMHISPRSVSNRYNSRKGWDLLYGEQDDSATVARLSSKTDQAPTIRMQAGPAALSPVTEGADCAMRIIGAHNVVKGSSWRQILSWVALGCVAVLCNVEQLLAVLVYKT